MGTEDFGTLSRTRNKRFQNTVETTGNKRFRITVETTGNRGIQDTVETTNISEHCRDNEDFRTLSRQRRFRNTVETTKISNIVETTKVSEHCRDNEGQKISGHCRDNEGQKISGHCRDTSVRPPASISDVTNKTNGSQDFKVHMSTKEHLKIFCAFA